MSEDTPKYYTNHTGDPNDDLAHFESFHGEFNKSHDLGEELSRLIGEIKALLKEVNEDRGDQPYAGWVSEKLHMIIKDGNDIQ